jgi:hypothetical protein
VKNEVVATTVGAVIGFLIGRKLLKKPQPKPPKPFLVVMSMGRA